MILNVWSVWYSWSSMSVGCYFRLVKNVYALVRLFPYECSVRWTGAVSSWWFCLLAVDLLCCIVLCSSRGPLLDWFVAWFDSNFWQRFWAFLQGKAHFKLYMGLGQSQNLLSFVSATQAKAIRLLTSFSVDLFRSYELKYLNSFTIEIGFPSILICFFTIDSNGFFYADLKFTAEALCCIFVLELDCFILIFFIQTT